MPTRRSPGQVRDAILKALKRRKGDATVAEIAAAVERELGKVPASSIRSYLRLASEADQPKVVKTARGRYALNR